MNDIPFVSDRKLQARLTQRNEIKTTSRAAVQGSRAIQSRNALALSWSRAETSQASDSLLLIRVIGKKKEKKANNTALCITRDAWQTAVQSFFHRHGDAVENQIFIQIIIN